MKKLQGPRSKIGIKNGRYPDALRNVRNPPESIYVIGDISALQEGLAIVGARRATPYGLGCATRFARIAASKGICIISGGARGCDAAAHKGALEAGGKTVAFLGGGCDMVYPKENFGLFQQIIDNGGAIVSENDWECPALPFMFRARNRLIAGLSKATLIVEAGLPSGTFSTADEALSANRDVLVVPGAITSAHSRGANRLIYQGATPIIDDDIFENQLLSVFGILKQESLDSNQCSMQYTGWKRSLLEAMQAEPRTPDELLCLVPGNDDSKRISTLMSQISMFEVEDLVCKYPHGKYGAPIK